MSLMSPLSPWSGRAALVGGLAGALDDLVDEAVLERLVGGEPAVAVGVVLDLLDGLAGVLGDQLEQDLLDVERLLGLDLDVGGRATHARGRLVHHDPRVRQGVALALGAGAEQELAHRRGQAHADRGDVVRDVVHGVVDRHAGVHRATGAVDVQEDVGVGVLGGQQQQLGADRVGVLVAHLGAEEDDPLAQQSLVDVVVESVHRRGAVHLRAGVLGHECDPSPRDRQFHAQSPAVRHQQISAGRREA